MLTFADKAAIENVVYAIDAITKVFFNPTLDIIFGVTKPDNVKKIYTNNKEFNATFSFPSKP